MISATSRCIRIYFLEMALPALVFALLLGVGHAWLVTDLQAELREISRVLRMLQSAYAPGASPGTTSGLAPGLLRNLIDDLGLKLSLLFPALFLAYACGGSLLNLWIALRIGQRLRAEPRTLRADLLLWLRRIPAVCMLCLPIAMLVLLGFVLCLLPGWLALSYLALVPALVALHPRDASLWLGLVDLLRGRLFKTCLVLTIITLGSIMIQLLIPLPVLWQMAQGPAAFAADLQSLVDWTGRLSSVGHTQRLILLQCIQALPQSLYVAIQGVAGTIMYLNYTRTALQPAATPSHKKA